MVRWLLSLAFLLPQHSTIGNIMQPQAHLWTGCGHTMPCSNGLSYPGCHSSHHEPAASACAPAAQGGQRIALKAAVRHVQGELVSDMRYLASVVTQCFTAFGELLALHKRFVELSGGVSR